jgi:hypothetical protein
MRCEARKAWRVGSMCEEMQSMRAFAARERRYWC